VPIDVLRFAVENGRDPGRVLALFTVESLTETPEARALPREVIACMYLHEPEPRVLLDDLRADPQRIRNAAARCLVQYGLEHHVPVPRCRPS
jgi:hypothetical protein